MSKSNYDQYNLQQSPYEQKQKREEFQTDLMTSVNAIR